MAPANVRGLLRVRRMPRLPTPSQPASVGAWLLAPVLDLPQRARLALNLVTRRILGRWAANHARPSTAASVQRAPRKPARKPTSSPARLGTSGCSALRD